MIRKRFIALSQHLLLVGYLLLYHVDMLLGKRLDRTRQLLFYLIDSELGDVRRLGFNRLKLLVLSTDNYIHRIYPGLVLELLLMLL